MLIRMKQPIPRNSEPGADGTSGVPPVTPPTPPVVPPVVPPVEPVFTPYTLSLPDGVKPDQKTLDAFTKIVNDAKVPKSVAEQIVKLQVDQVKAAEAAADQEYQAQLGKWEAEVKAIPNYEIEMSAIRADVLKFFDGETVKTLFQEGDFLKHPGIVKGLAAIAKRLGPDRGAEGTRKPVDQSNEPRSLEDRLFPNLPKV